MKSQHFLSCCQSTGNEVGDESSLCARSLRMPELPISGSLHGYRGRTGSVELQTPEHKVLIEILRTFSDRTRYAPDLNEPQFPVEHRSPFVIVQKREFDRV